MVDLPPIPDEARAAAFDDPISEQSHDLVDGILTAAWPHLYAAALRHAAERIVSEAASHSQLSRDVAGDVATGLHRLADEATP